MTKKTTSVDAAPQEEAKKSVKKTRTTTRKTAKKPAKKAETPVEEAEKPVVEKPVEAPKPVAEKPAEAQKPAKPARKAPRRAPKKQEKPAEAIAPEAPAIQESPEKPEKPATPAKPKEPKPAPAPKAEQKPEPKPAPKEPKPEPKPIPPLPNILINDVIELANAPKAAICLNDQQVQQLTVDEAFRRFQFLEYTLANVLDYDIVLSDTNIWLELLVGHTSSHSDPRVNARLQFERQLEFISKLAKHRGGRFMIMAETYEEIDRFATMQEPTNYRDADWTDEALCRNVAARLAKRLILSQQRENRLRIQGIGSESHHSAFADPAIIRRTVELFSKGYKVLLLTNDASVAIRSMGMCDDLQRHNNIDDHTWDALYAPLRPMVMTMEDLKMLDAYTRQYHFLQMAAGAQWMQDIPKLPKERLKRTEDGIERHDLELWEEGFRPGDRHEHRSDIQARQREEQRKAQKQAEEQRKREEAERKKAEEQRKREEQRQRDRQRAAEKKAEEEARKAAEEAKRAAEEAAKNAADEAAKQSPEAPVEAPVAAEQPAPEVPVATEETTENVETPKKKPSRRGGRGRGSRSKKTEN